MEDGAGFPSTVSGSISSVRVPSGSYKFICRFRFVPVRISIGREYCLRAGLASSAEIQFAYAIGYPDPVSVCINTFGTGVVSDADGVVKRFGVTPESIPDWLALVGDSSDGFLHS